MHGTPPPPEYVRTLRELLALADRNHELEAAVEAFAMAVHKHGLKVGRDMGYEEGLRQGRIRGRRRAKALPEEAKRRGRPMSVARVLGEAGLAWPVCQWQDFSEK